MTKNTTTVPDIKSSKDVPIAFDAEGQYWAAVIQNIKDSGSTTGMGEGGNE